MAVNTFKLGMVKIEGNKIAGLKNGTLTVTHNMESGMVIGDSWESDIILHGQWEVSLECDYDPDDTAQAALRTDFVAGGSGLLQTTVSMYTASSSASTYFTGSAIITGATITRAVGAPDKISFPLKGQGALSYTA
jgi:hypothetical protein